MSEQSLEQVPIEINRGINLDVSPTDQPKGSRRFTLNAVEETNDGEQGSLSTESSNAAVTSYPEGYKLIGDVYIGDNTVFVILQNESKSKQILGLLDRDDRFKILVETGVLSLKLTNQCDIKYRLRSKNRKTVYWVDGDYNARVFSINEIYDYYNQDYKDYLVAGGNPSTYPTEKYDKNAFDLIKSYSKVPTFDNIVVEENGSILPSSINFAIHLVDDDLNSTNWITTSNTVNIYNDNLSNSYERIRGSKNVQNDYQNFPRTNKSIKLTLGNLDQSFPYYRIAIIIASGTNGTPSRVLVSDLHSTRESTFIYTGNDSSLTETALGEILVDKSIIFAPKYIEQIENKLILAYTKDKSINWCEFQASASKIKSDLTTKQVILNSLASEPNVKNAKSTFFYRGYMPNEVYSFSAFYLFDDGYISPGFHIPGKNANDTVSKMDYHEIESKYLPIHNCANNNYWGVDAKGSTLLGKNVRHHKFPSRLSVNKPLVTSTDDTNDVTKYRLSLVISLNPSYTPSPNVYPNDSGVPRIIPYKFNYHVTGASTDNSYLGQLTDQDVIDAKEIIIYDGVTPLATAFSGQKYELDASSTLASYQVSGDERFIITPTYALRTVTSNIKTDISEVFGIKFSNIQRPHPNVVGVYICRNERLDEDKLVIDNAILGAMTEFESFRSFGLINPEQFYDVADCGPTAHSNTELTLHKKGLWFFSPEFMYLQKKGIFKNVKVEGRYKKLSKDLPPCNLNDTRGVYLEDIQSGTSYNPDITTGNDNDGFDLLAGYRNINSEFDTTDVEDIEVPIVTDVLHINAASYINKNNATYYNTSVDNKIGMALFDDNVDTSKIALEGDDSLYYAALTRENNSSYSNFMNRPFYKEHNNALLFGQSDVINNVEIFNGDVQISGFNFISSIFYDIVVADRSKKSKIWQIVLGTVLIVAGVLLALPSGGTSLGLLPVAAAALSSLAISYGVSLAVSGIKFEQFKSMVNVDYEKGLKETVVDGSVFECIRDTIGNVDDTIRWFIDRSSNLYVETTVPFGLRAGLTAGVTDFIDAPANYNQDEFIGYITEKLTTIDRDQGSGRLYKGYATAEFYDINLDYMRFNKEKVFIHLPIEYDCCLPEGIFPVRVHYSEESFQEEKTDNYRVFLPNNYRDIEGETGEITDLYRLGDHLFIHTAEGLWQLPQNNQERITGELVSFIGTGEFFSIPPKKIIDDGLGSGGTKHNWATVKTPYGVVFVDETQHKIYLHNDKLKEISVDGIRNYSENNIRSFLADQLYNEFGVIFKNTNNPANVNGVGYISVFDKRHNRLIFTKRDYKILASRLPELIIVENLLPIIVDNIELVPTPVGFVFNKETQLFYYSGNILSFNNSSFFESKSFTISYSFHTNKWISWHSYLPNYYIRNQDNFYSSIDLYSVIWRHNIRGSYLSFYNQSYSHIIEIVCTSSKLMDKMSIDLIIQSRAREYNVDLDQYVDKRFITFNKLICYNDRQCSGEYLLAVKESNIDKINYLKQQISETSGTLLITRKERDWQLNGFRDYVDRYDLPIFTSKWEDISTQYFIDKIVNSDVINRNKNWWNLENFKDKYIIFRLKFDNFTNVCLTTSNLIPSETNITK